MVVFNSLCLVEPEFIHSHADKINTLAADTMGDILLEDVGGGYAVLEDYIEETKGAINNDQ